MENNILFYYNGMIRAKKITGEASVVIVVGKVRRVERVEK